MSDAALYAVSIVILLFTIVLWYFILTSALACHSSGGVMVHSLTFPPFTCVEVRP